MINSLASIHFPVVPLRRNSCWLSLARLFQMLGVHRQTIYYIVANGDFELIKVGRYKRATKESFEKWYQNQTRYRLVAEDGQERR